jgi:hypothetical protein
LFVSAVSRKHMTVEVSDALSSRSIAFDRSPLEVRYVQNFRVSALETLFYCCTLTINNASATAETSGGGDTNVDRAEPRYAARVSADSSDPGTEGRRSCVALDDDFRHKIDVRQTAQTQRPHGKHPLENIRRRHRPSAAVNENTKFDFIAGCKAGIR